MAKTAKPKLEKEVVKVEEPIIPKLQDDAGILADGKIDGQDVKHILRSKTVWVNILAFVAFFLQSKWGYVMDEATQAQVLTVINIGLRYVTSEPVKWN